MSGITQAYIDGDLKWVRLDRDILELNPEELNRDVSKLSKRLYSEQSRNRNVIGVIETKTILITLLSNNTFTGIIWDTRKSLKGTYAYL